MSRGAATGSTRRNLQRVLRANVLGSAVGLGTQFATAPYLVHTLGLRVYGTYAVLATWLAFGVLVDFGVRAELVRRIAAANGAGDRQALQRAVADGTGLLARTATVVLIVGAAASPLIVGFVFTRRSDAAVGNPRLLLIALLAVLCVGLVLDGFFSVLDGLQRGDVRARAGIVTNLVRAGTAVGLVSAVHSAWSLLAAAAVAAVANYTYCFVALRRIAPDIRLVLARLSPGAARGLLGVSAMFAAAQVCDLVDFSIDRLYLSRYVGSEAAAQYAIGTQLPLTLRGLALIPLGLLITAVAELRTSQPDRLDRIFVLVSRSTLAAAATAMAGVVALAPAFYALYLGSGYGLTATAAQLLAVAMFLNLLGAPWTLYAAGSGWYPVIAIAALSNLVVNATASLLLVQRIGYDGALYGSILGNLVGLVVLWLLIRLREHRAWLAPLVVPVVSAPLFALGLHLVVVAVSVDRWWEFALVAVAGGLVEVGLLHRCGVLDTGAVRTLVRRDPPA